MPPTGMFEGEQEEEKTRTKEKETNRTNANRKHADWRDGATLEHMKRNRRTKKTASRDR